MFLVILGLILGVVFSSFFEWTLHKYFMHQPVGKFDYAFRAHALVHHQIFKADETYHTHKIEDARLIPMAWWNGPVLVALCQVPFAIASLFIGNYLLMYGSLISCALYYATYEYIHWCMHLPKARRMEKSWLFRRLNGHHLLHHRYMHKNFNVVMPLADTILGTLVLRSKIRFPQPNSPAVPNVQPLDDREEVEPELVGK